MAGYFSEPDTTGGLGVKTVMRKLLDIFHQQYETKLLHGVHRYRTQQCASNVDSPRHHTVEWQEDQPLGPGFSNLIVFLEGV